MRVQSNKKTTVQGAVGIPTIHNIIISDRSGSMSGSKYQASCTSIKNELELLAKEKKVNFTQTLVEFDDQGGFSKEPTLVKHFWLDKTNPISFAPAGARGGTPLYDSLGKVLSQIEACVKSEDRVLVKVFTDGQDTKRGEGEWDSRSVAIYIKKLIDVNKWTITFNCTIQDKSYITAIGIPESNILTHENTAQSIHEVSAMRSASTMMYASSVSKGISADQLVNNFYTKTVK